MKKRPAGRFFLLQNLNVLYSRINDRKCGIIIYDIWIYLSCWTSRNSYCNTVLIK